IRTATAALVTSLAVVALGATGRAPDAAVATEVRVLWVLRTSLTSPDAIDTLIARATASGINALFVQVRPRGDAYYAPTLEPRGTLLASQPETFDPLAHVITRAHARAIAVHA